MIKVITYGTYDLLHFGHIKLLERAKALGDYLVVGVTADDFDKTRGKINVQQSLMERIEAVRATGIADEIIVEEYEGQKIDDIQRYGIDIFTVGSDWEGKFDYLNEYCKVVYLPRTQGVSSSDLRSENTRISVGLVGNTQFMNKVINEIKFVNGLKTGGICTDVPDRFLMNPDVKCAASYDELLDNNDAVYIRSEPSQHYEHILKALNHNKHILCEAPMTLDEKQWEELQSIAKEKNLVLMDAVKTAYATAYARLLLLIKSGCIGDIKSVDVTCTSLKNNSDTNKYEWDCLYEWGPTALLPVFQILGTKYKDVKIAAHSASTNKTIGFLKGFFLFDKAVATIKIGDAVKSEGDLIISGTKGYIYVPSPWWKTDYFEVRFENSNDNKRYFYQLDGEGIRYELVEFARAVSHPASTSPISSEVSRAICSFVERVDSGRELYEI